MVSEISAQSFRNGLGHFASGVTIITTEIEGQTHGMTATAFMSVSLNPPLVLIAVGQHTRLHRLLVQSRRYGVSILDESQQVLSNHFAGRSDQHATEIPFIRKADMPLIDGAVAHIVARVMDMHDAGDHTLFIGQVEYVAWQDTNPLIYYTGEYKYLKADTEA